MKGPARAAGSFIFYFGLGRAVHRPNRITVFKMELGSIVGRFL